MAAADGFAAAMPINCWGYSDSRYQKTVEVRCWMDGLHTTAAGSVPTACFPLTAIASECQLRSAVKLQAASAEPCLMHPERCYMSVVKINILQERKDTESFNRSTPDRQNMEEDPAATLFRLGKCLKKCLGRSKRLQGALHVQFSATMTALRQPNKPSAQMAPVSLEATASTEITKMMMRK